MVKNISALIMAVVVTSCSHSRLAEFSPIQHCNEYKQCSIRLVELGESVDIQLTDDQVKKCVETVGQLDGIELDKMTAYYNDCKATPDPCAYTVCMLLHADASTRALRIISERFTK